MSTCLSEPVSTYSHQRLIARCVFDSGGTLLRNWYAEVRRLITVSSLPISHMLLQGRNRILDLLTLYDSAFCFDWINKRITFRCGQRKIIERSSSQAPHLTKPCRFNDRVAACNACMTIQLTDIYTHISKLTRNVDTLRQYVQKIVTCRLLFGRLKQTKEFCFS